VTPTAAFAMDRLSHLAKLFDHARVHARGDSLLLSELLDQASMLLDEIAPAVAACKGGPDEVMVIALAREAQDHHEEMVAALGMEIERITKELERLARSSQANARYSAAGQTPRLRLIERSA
jgi:hypothetical protein